mgnify:CR=1 FL=1
MERWFTRRLCGLIMDPNSIQTAAAIAGAKTGGPVYSDDLFHQRIYQQTGNESSGNYESGIKLGDQGGKGGCLWFGRERSLDVRTSKLNITNFPFNNTTDFTMEFWIRAPRGLGTNTWWKRKTNEGKVLSHYSNDWFTLNIGENDHKIEFKYRDYPYNQHNFSVMGGFDNGSQQDLDGNAYHKRYLDDGKWHHYAFTLDGTEFHGFIDGHRVKYLNYTASGRPNFSGQNWTIGNKHDSNTASQTESAEFFLSGLRMTTECLYTTKFTPTFANTTSNLTNTQILIGCGANPLLEQANNRTVTNTGVIACDHGPDTGSDGNRGLAIFQHMNYGAAPTQSDGNHNRGGYKCILDTVRGGEDYNNKFLYLNKNLAEREPDHNTHDYKYGVNFHARGCGHAISTQGIGSDGENTASNRLSTWQHACKEGYLDIVTYTGNGSNRSIAHALGTDVGMMWIKKRSGTGDWWMFMGGTTYNKPFKMNVYNESSTEITDTTVFYQEPTSTHFSVGTHNDTNQSGQTYVAYIWSDQNYAKFGETEDQQMTACGSYTGTGNTNGISVTCGDGWKPAQVITVGQHSSGTVWWWNHDANSGNLHMGGHTHHWQMHSSSLQQTQGAGIELSMTSNGFLVQGTNQRVNQSGVTYYWFAWRDHDGLVSKLPTYPNDVYQFSTHTSDTDGPNFTALFDPDFALAKKCDNASPWNWHSRLQGVGFAKSGSSHSYDQDTSSDFGHEKGFGRDYDSDYSAWLFKHYQGFESMCYRGTGSNRTMKHHLGVVPEMMIFKKDHGSEAMIMYHKDIDPSGSSEDYYINMTSAGAPSYGTNVWNSTAPTKDVISLGSSGFNNDSSHDYVAYIFSSVEGFSKCGTYQGTGSTQNITGLGFKPRLLWIRQVHDGSSFNGNDFVVWTSERDNERLKFNSTSDSDTYDHIDYISDGFTVKDTGNVSNANGRRYIYYAHA